MVSLNSFVYSRMFGMDKVVNNYRNKIWVFSHLSVEIEVLVDHEQFLHCKLSSPLYADHVLFTFVYDKCSKRERLPLWDGLRALGVASLPWAVGVTLM